MAPDDDFERELAARLSAELDRVSGPQPRWPERVGEFRPRRQPTFFPAWWSGPWPAHAGSVRLAAIGSIGVVAVLIAGLLSTTLLGSPPAVETSPAIGASAPPAAGSTDGPASNPPHRGGTCPLTPITRLAGGSAPEVDVSGLRWRWGGVPWVAGMPEKVVWLADTGDAPTVSVFATELDLPIVINGHPVQSASATSKAVYALASDTGVAPLQVPQPGCWLLTAVWAQGASSVVVAVGPPPGPASPAPVTAEPSALSGPLVDCPATAPSTTPPPQGWPGLAYVDGPFRWLLPPGATWRIGGDGDKLVLDSHLGWSAGDRQILAFPVGRVSEVGRLPGTAVSGDIPPGFGGGTMGVGITLPARACWAFVYLDAATTSTIVDDLASTMTISSGAADKATALDVAGRYENALAGGDWPGAWALLSVESQATIGSLGSFAATGSAYNAEGGVVFSLQTPTQDANLVATFLGASQAAIALEADTSRGFLVFVHHPNVKAASAGTTGLYVAPLRSEGWPIWLVH